MTTPVSGAISLSDVRAELQQSGAISLNDASVRALAFIPSGGISLFNLYNKAFCKMTAGVSGTTSGYSGVSFPFGSMSPATLYGYPLDDLLVNTANTSLQLVLGGSAPRTVFNNINLNGIILSQASATFAGGTTPSWTWSWPYGALASGTVYPVYFD